MSKGRLRQKSLLLRHEPLIFNPGFLVAKRERRKISGDSISRFGMSSLVATLWTVYHPFVIVTSVVFLKLALFLSSHLHEAFLFRVTALTCLLGSGAKLVGETVSANFYFPAFRCDAPATTFDFCMVRKINTILIKYNPLNEIHTA
ncbi:hypothetical protein Plhal304r1_c066g0154591 [Plasmopara halstedii]